MFRRFRLANIVATVGLVLGLCLINYPAVATTLQALDTADATRATMVPVKKAGSLIKEAEEYNRRLQAVPVLDPWLNKMRGSNNLRYVEYLKTLDLGDGLMAQITIPSIGVMLPVFHDTTDDVLAKGAGHLFGSHLPIGGKDRMSVIAAHRGLPNAAMFDRLPELKKGDNAFITIGATRHAYTVYNTRVVLPGVVNDLQVEKGRDRLILVTCTPYGINSHRLIVELERNLYLEKKINDNPGSIVVHWWERIPYWVWIIVGFDILLLSIVAVKVASKLLKERKRRDYGELAKK